MHKDIIKNIWSEELNIQNIAYDDDFFLLGGHSLIMTKIQVRIKKECEILIPMEELFRNSSINSISKYIRQQEA